MSDEVDLVTWLRDVADMKARVYRMEFEAKRFRACADELAELRKENERMQIERDDAIRERGGAFDDLRNEQVAELRSIRDRLLEWYEAGHQGYSDIEDIIAAAKASKDGTL